MAKNNHNIKSQGIFDSLSTQQDPLQNRMFVLKMCIDHVVENHAGKHKDLKKWKDEYAELQKINRKISMKNNVVTVKAGVK